MANQSGIAISIRAFLPTGKTLEEQYDALTLIKEAKTTGKFDAVLAKSLDIEVKTESKVRRTADAPAGEQQQGGEQTQGGEQQQTGDGEQNQPDEIDPPDFAGGKSKARAA